MLIKYLREYNLVWICKKIIALKIACKIVAFFTENYPLGLFFEMSEKAPVGVAGGGKNGHSMPHTLSATNVKSRIVDLKPNSALVYNKGHIPLFT